MKWERCTCLLGALERETVFAGQIFFRSDSSRSPTSALTNPAKLWGWKYSVGQELRGERSAEGDEGQEGHVIPDRHLRRTE